MLYIHFPSWLKPEIISGLPLRWYGLMYIVAFAVTYYLTIYQIKKNNLLISKDDVSNFFFWCIIGLILGARIFSALIYDTSGTYLTKPWLIFWPFDGQGRFVGLQGMSYHGGLAGLAAASFIYCRVKKQKFLVWADLVTAGVPLGYTFGRLGNFINGELYGRVSAAPWAMVFPHAMPFDSSKAWVAEMAEKIGMDFQPGEFVNLPRHPSQLYEAFGEGILLWLILWFVIKKHKKFNGMVLSVYLMGYGLVRFIVEYFRCPDKGLDFPISFVGKVHPYLLQSPWAFSTGQILCFLMIVAGAGLFAFTYFIHKRKSQPAYREIKQDRVFQVLEEKKMQQKDYSIKEIIELAVQIEEEGISFYHKAAEKQDDDKIKKLLLQLADEEAIHRKNFKALLDKVPAWEDRGQLDDQEFHQYMNALVEDVIFPRDEPVPDDNHLIINLALEKEKDSILFYEPFLDICQGKDRDIIFKIIEEEKKHILRLLEIRSYF